MPQSHPNLSSSDTDLEAISSTTPFYTSSTSSPRPTSSPTRSHTAVSSSALDTSTNLNMAIFLNSVWKHLLPMQSAGEMGIQNINLSIVSSLPEHEEHHQPSSPLHQKLWFLCSGGVSLVLLFPPWLELTLAEAGSPTSREELHLLFNQKYIFDNYFPVSQKHFHCLQSSSQDDVQKLSSWFPTPHSILVRILFLYLFDIFFLENVCFAMGCASPSLPSGSEPPLT